MGPRAKPSYTPPVPVPSHLFSHPKRRCRIAPTTATASRPLHNVPNAGLRAGSGSARWPREVPVAGRRCRRRGRVGSPAPGLVRQRRWTLRGLAMGHLCRATRACERTVHACVCPLCMLDTYTITHMLMGASLHTSYSRVDANNIRTHTHTHIYVCIY